MSIKLHSPRHIHLYEMMRDTFSDIPFFAEKVSEKLKLAILDCDDLVLTPSIVKKFAERYYTALDHHSKLDKEMFRQIKWIFKTLCVYIVSQENRARDKFFQTTEELTEAYPEFLTSSPKEVSNLLVFCNMVKTSLLIIEARLNKQLIIDIAARLEGNQNKYITGSGQSAAVSRRVTIFEKEGRIEPEKRPYRLKMATLPDRPHKRKTDSSLPTGPVKVQARDKINRTLRCSLAESVFVSTGHNLSSSPDITSTTATSSACDALLTFSLSDMDALFELEEVTSQRTTRSVPMICTPILTQQDPSTFVFDEIHAALDSGFYRDPAAASRALGHTADDEFSQVVDFLDLHFPDISERSWLTY